MSSYFVRYQCCCLCTAIWGKKKLLHSWKQYSFLLRMMLEQNRHKHFWVSLVVSFCTECEHRKGTISSYGNSYIWNKTTQHPANAYRYRGAAFDTHHVQEQHIHSAACTTHLLPIQNWRKISISRHPDTTTSLLWSGLSSSSSWFLVAIFCGRPRSAGRCTMMARLLSWLRSGAVVLGSEVSESCNHVSYFGPQCGLLIDAYCSNRKRLLQALDRVVALERRVRQLCERIPVFEEWPSLQPKVMCNKHVRVVLLQSYYKYWCTRILWEEACTCAHSQAHENHTSSYILITWGWSHKLLFPSVSWFSFLFFFFPRQPQNFG